MNVLGGKVDVAAKADGRVNAPVEEILDGNFEDYTARTEGVKCFQMEIPFQNNTHI